MCWADLYVSATKSKIYGKLVVELWPSEKYFAEVVKKLIGDTRSHGFYISLFQRLQYTSDALLLEKLEQLACLKQDWAENFVISSFFVLISTGGYYIDIYIQLAMDNSPREEGAN
ncbi:hypothetical protein A2223_02410 [Candidatus Falkowbacteria bacterium RIFOXYA2_FULL_35_8]|nr:MAG: hypothetical protein A2223_02410 [Candidatus Falkowbacteria bacterium RIFOXYA2_FULL_35_8]